MPKTQAEIDALKVSWREDQTWDIEETEGFEAHRAELAAFRQDIEAARDAFLERQRGAAIERLIKPVAALALKLDVPCTLEDAMRLAAEMLLPLQRQLERQAEDIEAMQRRHEDELDALRRRIGGQ